MTRSDAPIPATAMVLAAGRGTRMRHLTDERPKPLIRLAGAPLIDRVLDHLRRAGVERIVVNTHYHGEMLADHLAGRDGVALSPEQDLLETGGGVQNALPLLGAGAFFTVNSDAVWIDGPTPALQRLRDHWDEDAMDALLLMYRMTAILGPAGRGDYFLDSLGRASRRRDRAVAPYLFTGIQILHPRLFDGEEPGRYSLNRLYDKAERQGRLWGVVHDGAWYHVGTPEQRRQAEYEITHDTTVPNHR